MIYMYVLDAVSMYRFLYLISSTLKYACFFCWSHKRVSVPVAIYGPWSSEMNLFRTHQAFWAELHQSEQPGPNLQKNKRGWSQSPVTAHPNATVLTEHN